MMSERRKRFFHYMFTTAIEGGVNYWAITEEYHIWKGEGDAGPGSEDLDGFYAILSNSEDDWGVDEAYIAETCSVQPITETQSLRVELEVIKRGWDIFASKVLEAAESENPSHEFGDPYFCQALLQYLTNMEEGDSDANVADLVVQLGLFGEVVYS